MPKRPMQAEDLAKMALLGDPQVHPHGTSVLYCEKRCAKKNRYETQLWLVGAQGGEPRQLTFAEPGASMGRWSPDGTQVAFVSGREGKRPQVFLLPMDGGEARALTELPEGSIGAIRWSPDGRRIAISFRPNDEARTQEAQSKREAEGLSEPPWAVEELFYRLDGDGYFGAQRFRPYVLDVATGKAQALDAGGALGLFSFDWLPDSSGLVLAASACTDPLLEKPNDQLYLVPLRGKAKRIASGTKGTKSSPSVSPDGRWIAYLGSDRPDDPWGVHNTRLWVVPSQGGKARCLTLDDHCLDVLTLSDTSFGFVADGGGSGLAAWSPDSKSLFVNVGHHGAVHLARVELASGGLELVTPPRTVVVGTNVAAKGGLVACTSGTVTSLAEVALYDPAKRKLRTLTRRNEAFHQEVELVAPSEHWVKSEDGTKVHTWRLRGRSKAKRRPALLAIHGGPHAQYGWAVFHEFQFLAAQGYDVVYSNPRGSKGYGEAFCAAIRGRWGDKDWQDVSAVAGWMRSLPDVDPSRLGVMGGSYGGYMTNWAVSHTGMFKAAITDRCVFNWLSAAGNSDFPLNKDGYFGGQAWGDHEKIRTLWEQSPVAHFESVRTPMLVIHSAGDLRCNVEQGEQVFFVLKSLGVPARLVRYPASTSHGLSRSGPMDLRLHRLGEILAWWKRWL
jgi:dipeptidyl aminopeptidase/acylaminoacyl peptidase